jgi:GR25 family glycosyltransferase involved in LPS biosynthesis
MNTDYQVYCLSFNNPTRKENMKRRFDTIGIDCIFYEGVNKDDIRMTNQNNIQVWSCMYGHLDMISDFYYNTDKPFGIFCEDDIFIHKELKNVLPNIMIDFDFMKLDVLLLGYLLSFKLDNEINYRDFPIKHISTNSQYPQNSHNTFTYYDFPDDVWGTQMYMLSRTSAKKILDKYSFSSGYADKTIHDPSLVPFSADWTITKDGRRALITPILATEDNQTPGYHGGQKTFHENCFHTHFDSDLFIV